MDRKKHKWNTVVTDEETGKVVEGAFETYWSPTHTEDEPARVAEAAAAMETVRTRRKFLPVSASLAKA